MLDAIKKIGLFVCFALGEYSWGKDALERDQTHHVALSQWLDAIAHKRRATSHYKHYPKHSQCLRVVEN